MKAFTQLPDQIRQKTKLTFVGDGPLRQTMMQLINSLQLAENVTILGHRNDVVELMQRATLLVLPSRWEGMPNVVLEAMANNLPVIATAVDGTLDLVQHERTGWLVEPQQPQQLATAIAEALTGPEKRRQIARNAQNLVAMNYDWNSIVKRYDGLLRSLVSQKLSGHSL